MIKKYLIKHNIIKGTFLIEPFIYVDKKGNPTLLMTGRVKWLKSFSITCLKKDMYRLAFEQLDRDYPQYRGCFNLF